MATAPAVEEGAPRERVRALEEALARLAERPSIGLPVVSLYLDARADGTGKDRFAPFVRKALASQVDAIAGDRPDARASLDRDVERIWAYLADLDPAANAVALFACAGDGDFFEALRLDAPLVRHRLYVDAVPHVLPLARLVEAHPPCAMLLLDGREARLLVAGLGTTLAEATLAHDTPRRTTGGGWAQSRIQRRVDEKRLFHVKESAARLDELVREQGIARVVLGGEEEAVAALQKELPPALAERVAAVLSLPMLTPDHEAAAAAVAAVRRHESAEDAARAAEVLDAAFKGGRGAAGAPSTESALAIGAVDELLLTAAFEDEPLAVEDGAAADPALEPQRQAPVAPDALDPTVVAEDLVRTAFRTRARVRFVDDPSLLAGVGGVAARLRWRP
jgi:peptide subunit release factor 1 (eRF1)